MTKIEKYSFLDMLVNKFGEPIVNALTNLYVYTSKYLPYVPVKIIIKSKM